MTPLPRGTCPHCGREVALRRGGKVREHMDAKTGETCLGSGRLPVDRR